MSKEVSKTRSLQTQLDISREEIKNLIEDEGKLKLSNFALEERLLLIETRLQDTTSELEAAERQCAHEKSMMLRMKEEGNEKTKMLQEAHEINVIFTCSLNS